MEVADATLKESRSQVLPKFQAEYGRQKIDGQTGFYQYQVGISIPLFFGPELGRTQSARIDREIAEANLQQTQLELNSAYAKAREEYLKWHNSWKYYQEQALPLAIEQREGAIIAYREGAIDYVTFLQNIRDAVRIEINAWEALASYLDSRSQLEYYINTPE